MSNVPTTPRANRTVHHPTTPATNRLNSSHITQASPHYTTTRRHSLYGVEDRVVVDPGSRIWKVGFSGEGKPRDVFFAAGKEAQALWKLSRTSDPQARLEEDKMLEVRLRHCLRSVFHDSLLTDPKARKVIIIETPLLPMYIKEMMARILFENQVPSVSFAPSHLLSLMAVGRITGLVIDCGHLESVALPIFAGRPLFPRIQTTPLAGERLTSHLRALLLMFATYLPPPTSLSAAINVPAANRATRVPPEVLSDLVVEEIKTRCCFVGPALDSRAKFQEEYNAAAGGGADSSSASSDVDMMNVDAESTSSHAGFESTTSSQAGEVSSEFSIITNSQAESSVPVSSTVRSEGYLEALASMYKKHSTATDLKMRVTPVQQTGTGMGTLIIPGWIRERAAEVLFEGDVDESSLAETILNALLKIPVDLRKTLASSILVSGGTAMLPGFIPRLHSEIIRSLLTPTPPPSRNSDSSKRRPTLPQYDKYSTLRPLMPYFAILDNPSPPTAQSERARGNAGKAPAFTPAMLAWVGGSLAGALKTGGSEVIRENWDELGEEGDESNVHADDAMDISELTTTATPKKSNILPDWTRSPLRPGAPSAIAAKLGAPAAGAHAAVPSTPSTPAPPSTSFNFSRSRSSVAT
ncbi:actin-domain-containing protein [Ephemerocybe angulata]|uniref:Actin-domain-containing protein n=1 Tax=Ephemerocybe angulata TaxID=980116 RepID=A0A8H6I1X1_9AGAR|nr:actin-domain-containing protein [Tulosesus angulatus]